MTTTGVSVGLSSKMAHPKQYTLNDFRLDAQKCFPLQFAPIADVAAYKFERIAYMNGDQKSRQVDMLSIGHYYQKHSGVPVWASSNGYNVRYYFGKSSEVCNAVPEAFISRIYYIDPFKFMGVEQGCSDSKRRNKPGRLFEVAVMETVIHFLFLSSGRLSRVFNLQGKDMLGNLKFACLTLNNNRKAEQEAAITRAEQSRSKEEEYFHAEDAQFNETQPQIAQQTMPREHPSQQTSIKSANIGNHEVQFGLRSQHMSKRTSLLEQVLDYEAELDCQLALEEKDRQQEVEALRSKLNKEVSENHEAKIQLAAEKELLKAQRQQHEKTLKQLMVWKQKHAAQVEELENYKKKYERLKARFVKSKERNARLKARETIKIKGEE